MSIHAPDPLPAKTGSPVFAFLFLTGMAVAFLGTALVLGTEPRLTLERSGPGSFRVTGSNYFSGYQFFTKTIDGVTQVIADDAVRDGRRDSERENRKRRRQKHLDLFGADGARVGWDRENDRRQIEDFMRDPEQPRLALTDPPPLWRMSLAWFSAGFGVLIFIGAIQSNFFSKKASYHLP